MKSAFKHFILANVKFVLAAVLALGSLSCGTSGRMQMTDIDPSTGLFPASATIPDSSILEYKPTAISSSTLVYVRANIEGVGYSGFPERQLAWSEDMTSHIQKIGPWRVSRNLKDTAVACGTEGAESISLLGETKCQFLVIEIDIMHYDMGHGDYRMRITGFPGALSLLVAQGSFGANFTLISGLEKNQYRPMLNLLKKWHDQCGSTSSQCSWKKNYLVSNDYLDFAVNARILGVVPTDSEGQRFAERVAKSLAGFGYAASVLTPDKDLGGLVKEYCRIRGDIADKPFQSTEGHLENLATFPTAPPIIKRWGVDALILVSTKEEERNWLLGSRWYFDIALLTKSGGLGFYERDSNSGYCFSDSFPCLFVWRLMTTNK